jgi:hypothetical protein
MRPWARSLSCMLAPTSNVSKGSDVQNTLWLKMLVAPFIGFLLGLFAMFGLVYSQTQAPATNPASQPVLTYGD